MAEEEGNHLLSHGRVHYNSMDEEEGVLNSDSTLTADDDDPPSVVKNKLGNITLPMMATW